MYPCWKNVNACPNDPVSFFYMSKEDFINIYRKFDKVRSKEFHLKLLSVTEKAVSESNIIYFKKACKLIEYINCVETRSYLNSLYDSNENPIKKTNLVILACKHNSNDILNYVLRDGNVILDLLSVDGRTIKPNDEDEQNHNAFYYAIKSGNVVLLDTLYNKWPGNLFAICTDELHITLSKAYDELKIKNIPLAEQMEIFVEHKLINLRFFSRAGRNNQVIDNIKERVELVFENINMLKMEYLSNGKSSIYKLLFLAKFIAQNINILKQHMKSTYDRLPWEEMEFYLATFIYCHTKPQEMDIFYCTAMGVRKLINHLENFAKVLSEVERSSNGMTYRELAKLPILRRDRMVLSIVSSYPEFDGLYRDYKLIRDSYSLLKINDYICLALLTNPKEREGQLTIIRALQVIGENFKNTLEYPKLSTTISDRLLLSLPKYIREIIIDFRDSTSHSCLFSKILDLEEKKDVKFFIDVKKDFDILYKNIQSTLLNYQIKTIRGLLEIITNSDHLWQIKEVSEVFKNTKFDNVILPNLMILQLKELIFAVAELNRCNKDKKCYEDELIDQINKTIGLAKRESESIGTDYVTVLSTLNSLIIDLRNININQNVNKIKFQAKKLLENIFPQIKFSYLKTIAVLLRTIYNSMKFKLKEDDLDNVNLSACIIFYLVDFGTVDTKWIEEFRSKFNETGSFVPAHKQSKSCNLTVEKYNDQLLSKLSELRSLLKQNSSCDELIDKLPSYKNNIKLQAVMEMLVLDVMLLLHNSKSCLENNLLFLDDSVPVLTGESLLNHLANGNALVDLLSSDNSIAVILNAIRLISENIMECENKFGKLVLDDGPSDLKDKFHRRLRKVVDQESMFVASEEGNLEGLMSSLKKGADVNGRSNNSLTALHYAAKGNSVEIVKFLLKQNLKVNVKGSNGETPLHIAAANGRDNIVQFLLKFGLNVNEQDNKGRTALYFAAASGHENTVNILLKNGANAGTQDRYGFTPIYYAIKNNRLAVTRVFLMGEGISVDINEAVGDSTLLHEAAECGYLELVNILLENHASVDLRNDRHWTALHASSYYSHPEIAAALIANGANVNASTINGFTPLHYAVDNGNEDLTNILVENKANINAVDKVHRNTPLHIAANHGNESIVKILLNNNANAAVTNMKYITPLHFAAKKGLNIVMTLLKHDVNVNAGDTSNSTPLHYAVEYGHIEIVEFLIKNKANINATDEYNSTPLHAAISIARKDIIELLIKNKANVNSSDLFANTPLHYAACKISDKNIFDLLIKNKANVNARNLGNFTALHFAASYGHLDAVAVLIKNRAKVNIQTDNGITPLYGAISFGNVDIVKFLIRSGANTAVNTYMGVTPLCLAAEKGHKEIVEILIASGANVNYASNAIVPLVHAIKYNNKEIVEVLIANGANVNGLIGETLFSSVKMGHTHILEILLQNGADLTDNTLLHLAAENGYKEIVTCLISKGVDVDAVTADGLSSMHIAAKHGYDGVIEILIANKANVNLMNDEGAPIHLAATLGHCNVVQLLLINGAVINIKDSNNRTPLELAVLFGNVNVAKILLRLKEIDVNENLSNGDTLLHIATQESNLDMIKYLMDVGADINVENKSGLKPVHVAAKKGFKHIIELYLSNGLSVNAVDRANQTLLHYAAMGGHLEVVKYLIAQGADVNLKNIDGLTPMHFSAKSGYKNVIEILIKNGAFYNVVDNCNRRPLDMSKSLGVTNVLESTGKLLEAVKSNGLEEVENCIKSGGIVDQKNSDNGSPLHYAAWKGYNKIVCALLKNGADPNAVGNNGVTPLHYAAKFSHFSVVITLLSNGAIFNSVSKSGKTPLDFTVDKNIANLFKFVYDFFNNVKIGNTEVVNDMSKINDKNIIKAIMNTRNEENKSLIVVAMQSNFPKTKIEQLKVLFQGDVLEQITKATVLEELGKYEETLIILKSVLKRRKDILGADNPGTLDIQILVAKVLYKQEAYQEALNIFEEVLQKLKEQNVNNEVALASACMISLLMYKLGKYEEAYNTLTNFNQGPMEILKVIGLDDLQSRFEMALMLDDQGNFEEAMQLLEKLKIKNFPYDEYNLHIDRARATVLDHQGKYDEALKILKEVYEKMKINLGAHNENTVKTLQDIANVLVNQKKYHEALKTLEEVSSAHQALYGPDSADATITQHKIASALFMQCKWISALRNYKEIYDKLLTMFGPNDPLLLDCRNKIEVIDVMFKLKGVNTSEIFQHLQKDLNVAANNGDLLAVQSLIKTGADVNYKDMDCKTPLHYAVNGGHPSIVNLLIKNKARVTDITFKGNTTLHIAIYKGHKEIADILLQHVNKNELNKFINAKTFVSGTTSLHLAAKNGYLETVKTLLKNGAIYNLKNKNGETPFDVAVVRKVADLLKSVGEAFSDMEKGEADVIRRLGSMGPEEFAAVTGTRNKLGCSLIQVGFDNGHTDLTNKLLEMFGKIN